MGAWFIRIFGMALGAIVGSWFGAPWLGAAIGGTLFGIAANALFPIRQEVAYGPRLETLRVQTSSYGRPINEVYGHERIAGNIIWLGDITEHSESTEYGASRLVEYTYFAFLAIGICKGEMDAIIRIWADAELIVDFRTENEVMTLADGIPAPRIYLGSETQLPDSVIENYEGEGNVSAHRGLCYVVWSGFPLSQYGNRIPNFTFEVLQAATLSVPHLPIYNIEQSAWGSDELMWTYYYMAPAQNKPARRSRLTRVPEMLVQSSGRWRLINILNRLTIKSADYYADDFKIPRPDLTTTDCYDIDENRRVFTTGQFSGDTYLVIMDHDLVRIQSQQIDFIPVGFRVVRNAEHPWLYMESIVPSSKIYVVDRETLTYRMTYQTVDAPEPLQSIAIDHDNGIAWALSNSGVPDYDVHVTKVSPGGSDGWHASDNYDLSAYITGATVIAYDENNDQIILGSASDDISGDTAIAFFSTIEDSSGNLPFLGRLVGNYMGAWPKSAWRQGVVGGYLYLHVSPNKIYKIDVATRQVVKTWTTTIAFFGGGIYDPWTHSFIAMVNHTHWEGDPAQGYDMAKFLLDRASADPAILSDVVTDICSKVDLTASEIDVTELTNEVDGFAVNDRMPARSAIEVLQQGYFFDAIESGGKIKFLKRGQAVTVAIPESDLATHLSNEDRPQELVTVRRQEVELPRRIEVEYIDYAADYDLGVQSEEKQITESEHLANIRLPIVMNEDQAKQTAVIHLALAWMERNRHQTTVPNTYLYLDAADVITITEDGILHTVRIERITYRGSLLDLEVVNEDLNLYDSDATGTELPEHDDDIANPGDTTLELIDCPLFTSQHDRAGIYLATLGMTTYWHGATIRKSDDSGVNYYSWHTSNIDALIGIVLIQVPATTPLLGIPAELALGALGGVADPFVTDVGNSVVVALFDSADSISSVTELQMLNGSNLALVGDEIISFQTVTDNGNGTYTLSNLLRGRYGSDWATNTHTAGERFVLLDLDRLQFVDYGVADMDMLKYFRAQSLGSNYMGQAKQLTCELRNMMPLSPQHIAGSRDGSNNLTITWIRRTRIFGGWADLADVPLGETEELYSVDVYDGATVVRTISVTAETASYTAAQQTTDGLTPGNDVDIIVYQISSVTGRGFGTSATV